MLKYLNNNTVTLSWCRSPSMPVPFEVNPGDACLVIFADRDIDAWFESGEAEVPPSGRMHNLSDGFAFVGFRVGRTSGD